MLKLKETKFGMLAGSSIGRTAVVGCVWLWLRGALQGLRGCEGLVVRCAGDFDGF